MAIMFGSARIDENGNISGGRAGDQTGNEVSMQGYYMHAKGWYALRPKSADVAAKMATSMINACNNNNIGYDQSNRNVVSMIKKYGSTKAIAEKCETDCGNQVRGCILEATGKDVGDFYTGNEASVLEASGLFEKRFSVSSSNQLYNGDVLVTKSKGHTVIVVSGRPRSGGSSSGGSSSGSGGINTSYCGKGIGTGTCTGNGVMIRTGAGTNYTAIGSVNVGAQVEVLSKANGWYKIVWPGASVGYAYTSATYYSYVANTTNTSADSSTTYEVKSGDTLSAIAKKWGISTGELAKYNNISNPNVIYVGQVIHKPSSSAPSDPDLSDVDVIVRDGQIHANNFAAAGIETDGVRGDDTKKAGIKVLQVAMNHDYGAGLAVDGIWGSKSEVALKGHTVRHGEVQYMVTALQILLMLKGYNPNGVECPGSFGDGCLSATKSYQQNNGLEVDGIAGHNTFKSLIA